MGRIAWIAVVGATLVGGLVATGCLGASGNVSAAAADSNARSDLLCPDGECGVTAPDPASDLPEMTHAHFTWSLEHVRENSDARGSLSLAPTEFSDEDRKSLVTLRACHSTGVGGIVEYRWTFGDAAAPITTRTCGADWLRDLSRQGNAVEVTLTISATDGSTDSVTRTIRYRDIVIASLGDSAASGQGAPDDMGTFRISDSCHRSGYAASAQTALRLQNELKADTTVHFWFLACAGASITAAGVGPLSGGRSETLAGLLDAYNHAKSYESLPPQVHRLDELMQQSGLSVDSLLLTVGADDTPWEDVVQACLPSPHWYNPVVHPASIQAICVEHFTGPASIAVATLPARFSALSEALIKLVPRDRIYLTEYFDPLDSVIDPGAVTRCRGEVLAGQYLRRWGIAHVEYPLHDVVQDAAQHMGWNYIGGIREAFQLHGVCQSSADDRWINSWSDSQSHQNDANGSWHANVRGHTEIANLLYPVVLKAVTDNLQPIPLP